MKITCESCGAKYAIADEKVRGKTVKIRCKKCSTAIIVDGTTIDADQSAETTVAASPAQAAASATAPSNEWMLNMADGSQHSATLSEVVKLYVSGVANEETYVWKDGMSDWVPIAQVQEIMSLVAAAAHEPVPSTQPDPASAPAQPAISNIDWGHPGAAASTADAARPAARRADARAKDRDLFSAEQVAERQAPAQAMFPSAESQHLTAERNENSVLFTLDALKAKAGVSRGQPAAVPRDSVDLSLLAAAIPVRPQHDDARDLMNIGAGSALTASLAAPVLPTVAEPEPEPVREYRDSPGGRGSKAAIIVLAAALGLVVIGGGAFFVLRSNQKTAEGSTLAATTGETPTASKPAETAAPSATQASPAQSSTAAAAAPDTAAGDKGAAPGALAQAGAAAGKDKKTDTTAGKTEPGKAEPPKADTPAPVAKADTPPTPAKPDKPAEPASAEGSSDAPFDRGAAVAALSAAASSVAGCKRPDGPTGSGHVSVTFAPSGRVTTAMVEGPPFAGTSVGGCIAARFRGAHVPPFAGSAVKVGKSFTVE